MSKTSSFDNTPGGGTGGGEASRRDSGELAPGTQVGEYVLEGTLGRGGMGTVYAARHPVIGKRVAIKVLAGHMSGDPDLVRRFVDEARAVNKIGHPNIIDIFAFGALVDGRQYFVMEYLEGETLGARLAGSPMTVEEARRLLGQVASALEAAHREKIVHRDLKPENIWIARPKHGEPFIKILDFGIAKLLELTEGRNVTETGVVFGTPHFMAPEQCMGQNIDARTDIYALGVILYRVFGGKLPFEGKTFAEVVAQHLAVVPPVPSMRRKLAPGLEGLIMACLEKDPARRPQTAAEVGRRLTEALVDSRSDELTPEPLLPTMTAARPPDPAGTKQGYDTSSAAAQAAMEPPAPTTVRRLGRPLLVLAVAAAVVGAMMAVLAGRREEPPPSPAPGVASPTAESPAPPSAATTPPTTARPPAAATPPATATPPAGSPAVAPASPPSTRPRPREPRGAAEPGDRAPGDEAGGVRKVPSRAEKRGLIRDNPFR
jgi:eukaryotic-like serine/threonine-protein kinase